MNSRILFLSLILSAPVSFVLSQTTVAEPVFSANDLKKDLIFLKGKLETNHPGLYLYSEKNVIDKLFDSLENSILSPLTEQQFYKHITCISSIIKDGHTIILPAEKTIAQHNKTSKFLPYHFVITGNQLFVDMICTEDSSIEEGSEIISINNVVAKEIIQQMMDRQVRDGNNLTYPTWILSTYFRQYYSFIFGHPESYAITKKINDQEKKVIINGLVADSIYYYRGKRYPGKIFSRIANDGIKLKIEKDNRFALISIKTFDNNILKKEYEQNFKKVISGYFEQITNSKTENLIIDLRNNQGGDIENAEYLLSEIMKNPYTIVQNYFCADNYQLENCNGPSLGVHNPYPNNFKGNLYVLINGGSFSNSGIVASCLWENKRAAFIGEETGGNPAVITGFIKNISLPATNIQVQIPTKQFVITDKVKNTAHGLMPAYEVLSSMKQILNGEDPALSFTIELIKQKRVN